MSVDRAIVEIVMSEELSDQQSLVERLARRGFSLTQSALSRRLRRLGVEKRDGVYVKADPSRLGLPPYTLTASPPNLVVLRTRPGFAQPMALVVDRAEPLGFAGSVAGDDTVFFAASSADALPLLLRSIEAILRTR